MLIPALVVVILLVIQLAVVVSGRVELTHRCRAAAREAVVRPNGAAATDAGRRAGPGGEGFGAVVAGQPSVGALVEVRCTDPIETSVPLVGPLLPSVPMSETFVARIETLS